MTTILAAADLHGRQALYDAILRHAPSVDAVVLAGDLLERRRGDVSVRKGQRECGRILTETLRSLPCPLFFVMGNDDMVRWEPQVPGFRWIHGRREDLDGWNFVGYEYSLPFMGGIHEKPEDEVRGDLAALADLVDERTVLVTHMPAAGVLDRTTSGFRAGSPSLAGLVQTRSPRVHVHGHIHNQFGHAGRTFNVAQGVVQIELEAGRADVLVSPVP